MQNNSLKKLRNVETSSSEFRFHSTQIFDHMAKEIMKNIEPSGIVLVALLRAGIAMLSPFLERFTNAKVGFIGVQREKDTAIPQLYYENIPPFRATENFIILEPMIATGGTLTLALDRLMEAGASGSQITVASLICSVPGITTIRNRFPNVQIKVLVEDPELDDQKWIKPGLGDFGNRFFNVQ